MSHYKPKYARLQTQVRSSPQVFVSQGPSIYRADLQRCSHDVRSFSAIEKIAPASILILGTVQVRPVTSVNLASEKTGDDPLPASRSSKSTRPSVSFLHWSGPQYEVPAVAR